MPSHGLDDLKRLQRGRTHGYWLLLLSRPTPAIPKLADLHFVDWAPCKWPSVTRTPAETEHPRDIRSGWPLFRVVGLWNKVKLCSTISTIKSRSMNLKNNKEHRVYVQTSTQKETHFHHAFDWTSVTFFRWRTDWDRDDSRITLC